jgi:hypothetical protein
MRKIFMISAALTIFALASLLFQMTSCKKTSAQSTDNCPPAVYPITGLWEGTYQTDQVNQDTSMLPYSGGSIINKAKLTFSNTGTLTDGTWQDLSGQTYTGTFQNMQRNK